MRAEWDRDYVGLLSAIAATDLVVLAGVGTADGWNFEVRGDDRLAGSSLRAAERGYARASRRPGSVVPTAAVSRAYRQVTRLSASSLAARTTSSFVA